MVHPDPVGRVEPVNRRRGAELSCERVEEDDLQSDADGQATSKKVSDSPSACTPVELR